jgi:hypothetical protein
MLSIYLLARFPDQVASPLPIFPQDYPKDCQTWSTEAMERRKLEQKILMKNRFWSDSPPSFHYKAYIDRIRASMPKLETTVLLALPIYARRLETDWSSCLANGKFPPSGLQLGPNILHRFTITAICLASKALGDQFYSNSFCSAVGGISAAELHGLELELAARLRWDLQCSPEEYAWSWSQLFHPST